MPRLRAVRLTGSTPVVQRLRAVRLTGSGAAAAAPRLRAVRLTGSGGAAVTVAPLSDRTGVEPGSTITYTATLVGGGTADSWAWRRVSGAAIGLTATGATATFAAPSDLAGASVTVGVTATVGGVTSPEEIMTVTALPQTEWWWTDTGWTPHTEVWSSTP